MTKERKELTELDVQFVQEREGGLKIYRGEFVIAMVGNAGCSCCKGKYNVIIYAITEAGQESLVFHKESYEKEEEALAGARTWLCEMDPHFRKFEIARDELARALQPGIDMLRGSVPITPEEEAALPPAYPMWNIPENGIES